MFSKFWFNNIKTHYRQISIGIGTLTSSITTAVIGFCVADAIGCGNIELAVLIIGILLPIQGFINAMCYYIFGKAVNGNGYRVPETKAMVDVVKRDEEARAYMKDKILHYINKDSQLLNNFKKKEEEK